MPGAHRIAGKPRGGLALALLACALLMRLLVPQGWMPSQAGEGWTLTICTGSGAIQVELPAGHGPHGQDHPAPDHPCAFAAASQAPDAAALLPFAAPLLAPLTADLPAMIAAAVGRGLAAPPPPPTGPPSPL